MLFLNLISALKETLYYLVSPTSLYSELNSPFSQSMKSWDLFTGGAHALLGQPFSVYLFGGNSLSNLFEAQFLLQFLVSIHASLHPIFWVLS